MIAPPVTRRHRLSALAGRAVLATLIVGGVSMLGATAASALGNSSVDHFILTDPIPSWQRAPASVLQPAENQITSQLTSKTHETVRVAIDGWEPASGNAELVIVLVSFPNSSVPSSYNLTAGVNGACTGSGVTPGSVFPVAGIPGSEAVTCQSSSSIPLTAVAWKKSNVLAFVDSGGISSGQLVSICKQQDSAIPSSGILRPSSSSSSSLYGVVGVVVVALIVIAIVLLNRRRTAAAAAAGAGAAPGGDWVAAGAPNPQWGHAGAPQDPYAGAAPQYGGTPPPYSGTPPAYEGAPAAYPPAGGYATGAPAPQPAPYEAAPPPAAFGAPGRVGGDETVSAPAAPPAAGAQAPAGVVPSEPGWQPVEGDPNRQRYWDGTEWTSRLRWDGTAWVDES